MTSSEKKLNLLVAYPYANSRVFDELKKAEHKIRFLLDSGAFTAWKAGKEISLDDYCSFLEKIPVKPWRYFSLDVIGNPEATMENYQKMLERGFTPLPIFTRGENCSAIEKYYETSDVVGIGGLVGTKGNKAFVNGIMKKIGKRKVHLLGFTNPDYIKHYRPYMCDSSSWSSSVRYASAAVYLGNGQWKSFTKKTMANKPPADLMEAIRNHGVDPYRLSLSSEWSSGNREKEFAIETVAYRTWVRYSIDVEKNIGTKLFLACSAGRQVRLMVRAFDYWSEQK